MTDPTPTPGIHHVTCIASDPQRTVDFWIETLGLRLVKRSINQDDPETYHFFFADAEGTPGTSMTFFPWEDLTRGTVGSGQVSRTAFRVPEGSLDYWEDRFDEYGVDYDDRVERFGETVLPFRDPDGLPVELVEVEIPEDDPTVPWTEFVPEDSAIRGFHSVTLWLADPAPTADLLRTMGFAEVGTEQAQGDRPGDERTRFAATGPVGTYVDVLPTIESGRQGHGTVHHVAFQTPTDEDQQAMREAVQSAGLRPTQQIDRHWFRSVYFREFGGVLFELATSDPGYTDDEPLEELGERLVLPGKFEGQREQIEAGLTDVTVPRAEQAEADD
ncbi:MULTISPECIES: ring-cleaving dioxygenase [Haloarcula]|uniref:Diguanylate cyclase n=1 Tax=Haloarcula pellucida TaxID=1427151 RepID=A0A830GKE9_9EURY|nr:MULTISPECIES: ring-cleaving dioxygenase [Halomicroarcula]MBX0349878.1 ring-cleaving dioxygenase [Halomicroarcula pellucida]MDS0279621.1 ring-cleaving dioxygenase [Halomicroarcula sp. S1AR25-4]GGN94788.1 diguanylate cyclase [Halomicroarcula pellucida]